MSTHLDKVDWKTLAITCRGNVELMADTVLFSRKTIERYFHEKWGMSPARCAKQFVLQQAKFLIEQGYSNKAVVGDLKLCSESWLCREFKKVYGATPQFFAPHGEALS
jgi:methylphosphotriester-DNA--protein-cysteine methyltransferase